MDRMRTTSVYAWTLVCLAVALGASSGIAGTTGKVSGKITDGQTREALIGVNVLIVGTSLGAATDLEGTYFVNNIPPGTYQLKASAVGYSPVVVNDVKVFVDQTTRIDFTLQPEAIELQGVEVTATRPLVQRDLTSTTATESTLTSMVHLPWSPFPLPRTIARIVSWEKAGTAAATAAQNKTGK